MTNVTLNKVLGIWILFRIGHDFFTYGTFYYLQNFDWNYEHVKNDL
jgi:hypothetical protein